MGRSWFESGRDSVLQFGCARGRAVRSISRGSSLRGTGSSGASLTGRSERGCPPSWHSSSRRRIGRSGSANRPCSAGIDHGPDGCSSPVGESALHVAPTPSRSRARPRPGFQASAQGSDYIWIARLQAAPGITQAACSGRTLPAASGVRIDRALRIVSISDEAARARAHPRCSARRLVP